MMDSKLDKDAVKAGAAREVITPPRGTYLIGYAERWRGCTGVHDDLYATALVLADGARTVAILSCDLLCIHEDIVDRIRRQLPAGVEAVICCSHTHAGPITYADGGSTRTRRAYIDSLVGAIARAVDRAVRAAGPAVLSWTSAQIDIGVNRREVNGDGKTILGWNRTGPADRTAGVLCVTRPDGEPIATVVNHACHGTILPPDNLIVSSEWPGVMRAIVERDIGGLVLFIQGAAGDINPDYEWGEGDPWEAMTTLGTKAGRAVVEAVSAGCRPITAAPIRMVRREVMLPLEMRDETRRGVRRPMPRALEQSERVDTALFLRRLDAAGTGRRPSNFDGEGKPSSAYRKKVLAFAGIPTIFSFLTDRLLDWRYPWRPMIEIKDGRWCVPIRLSAIRIGDISLLTLGAEVFTEIGMNIKAAAPTPCTMFASVTDGCIGYLPTAAAHDAGGYEVDDAPFLYRYPARLARECETIAIEAAREACHELLR